MPQFVWIQRSPVVSGHTESIGCCYVASDMGDMFDFLTRKVHLDVWLSRFNPPEIIFITFKATRLPASLSLWHHLCEINPALVQLGVNVALFKTSRFGPLTRTLRWTEMHFKVRQEEEKMAKAACRVVLTFQKGDVCIVSMLWLKLVSIKSADNNHFNHWLICW